jgi:G:T-mismatch repair DNA endonuclease (very short patch repair protein)
VNKIIKHFCRKFFRQELSTEQFFNGNIGHCEKDNLSATLLLDALRFCVWECRLQKERISLATVEEEVLNLVNTILAVSSKIRTMIFNNNFINVDGRPANEYDPPERQRRGRSP